MPGYQAHIVGGAVVTGGAVAACHFFDIYRPEPIMMAALIAVGLLASLFPDTDTDSKGQHIFYGLMAFTDVILLINKEYEWAALLGLFAMLPAAARHRGWTHTWWAMLVVPMPIILIPVIFFNESWMPLAPFYIAAVLGYFSHLALDRQF